MLVNICLASAVRCNTMRVRVKANNDARDENVPNKSNKGEKTVPQIQINATVM